MANVGEAGAKSVLRRDTADGDVDGFASEEFFRATRDAFEIEATLLQLVEFIWTVNGRRICSAGSLLRLRGSHCQENQNQEDSSHGASFTFLWVEGRGYGEAPWPGECMC